MINYSSVVKMNFSVLKKYLKRNLGSNSTKRLRKKKYTRIYDNSVSAKIASKRACGKAW